MVLVVRSQGPGHWSSSGRSSLGISPPRAVAKERALFAQSLGMVKGKCALAEIC